MVRTLDIALTNALNAVTRCPALAVTIEDHVIHYASYQTPGNTDACNDVCIASDNSIVRVQVTRGGFTASFQVQRIIDPTQAAQWSSWTTLPGSSGVMFQDGGCAVSNTAGVLHAFAQQGTGGSALWNWTSLDNGATWTSPGLVLTPPGGALLKGISSASNNDVFFLYDVSGGDAIGCSLYAAGSWSALTTWTLPTIVGGAGIAAAWSGTLYTLIYSDGYTLATCTFTPGSATWSAGAIIAPSTSTAIGRIAPRLSFADGIYTLTCIELDTGFLTGTVYSYPRLRQSVDLIHWSHGMIVHDMTATLGAVAFTLPVPNTGSAGPRYYLATLSTVYSAPAFQHTNTAQYLDISAAVLSYQRHERVGKPCRIEMQLDNAQGFYNAFVTLPGTYQPLGLNASLVLSEGYAVGTPPTMVDVVRIGVYHLEEIRFMRSPQQNTLMLVGLDRSRNLDLIARYQNTYSNQTLGYLVTEVCARAGIFAIVLPATSQMGQLIASFVLQAGQSYRHALDELCSIYGLAYFLDQNEAMQFRELSSTDTPVWAYQPEIEHVTFANNDQRANHVVVSGKPPLGGLPGALTTAEAYDDAHLHLIGIERLLHHVDPKLTGVAQCVQKASFLMAQAVRLQVTHTATVPLNPALQLLDAITLTDSAAPAGSGEHTTCRIIAVQVSYDAQHAINEQQLTLEGM